MMFQAPFVRLRFNYQTLAIRPILMTHVRSSVTPFLHPFTPFDNTQPSNDRLFKAFGSNIDGRFFLSLRFSPFFVYNRARRFTQIPTNYA